MIYVKDIILKRCKMNKEEDIIEMEEGSEAFNAIGNSDLGPHRAKNYREEHFKIRKEMKRLRLRKGMRYEPERLNK